MIMTTKHNETMDALKVTNQNFSYRQTKIHIDQTGDGKGVVMIFAPNKEIVYVRVDKERYIN